MTVHRIVDAALSAEYSREFALLYPLRIYRRSLTDQELLILQLSAYRSIFSKMEMQMQSLLPQRHRMAISLTLALSCRLQKMAGRKIVMIKRELSRIDFRHIQNWNMQNENQTQKLAQIRELIFQHDINSLRTEMPIAMQFQKSLNDIIEQEKTLYAALARGTNSCFIRRERITNSHRRQLCKLKAQHQSLQIREIRERNLSSKRP